MSVYWNLQLSKIGGATNTLKEVLELLKHYVDWTAAYQSHCLGQVNPTHVHVDSLPTSCDDDGNEHV